MASASRLPLKSIAFSTAIVFAATASKVNLRKIIINTFTGPGMYSRMLAAVLILANFKNIPWAWHVRTLMLSWTIANLRSVSCLPCHPLPLPFPQTKNSPRHSTFDTLPTRNNELAFPINRMRLQLPQIKLHILQRFRRHTIPSNLRPNPTRHRKTTTQRTRKASSG
jgi:hypothetical protein